MDRAGAATSQGGEAASAEPAGPPRQERLSPTQRVAPVAGVLTLLLSYGLGVLTGTGQRVEDLGTRHARVEESARATQGAPSIGELANACTVTLVVVVLLLAFRAVARGRYKQAARAAALVAGAVATTEVLKLVLLPRPDLSDVLGPGDNTLPSGHTTMAFAAVAASLLLVRRSARWSGALLGATAAGAVGEATLTAGWHRASDVVAAYAVVLVWTALTTSSARRLDPVATTQDRWNGEAHRRVALSVLVIAAAVLAAMGAARLVVVAATQVVTLPALQAAGVASVHAQILVGLSAAAAATALLMLIVGNVDDGPTVSR
jgi:membrane-associated phospholipid phosphatase